MIKNNKGISMITLVVTIAVLLILAVIAFGNSTRSIDKAAEEKMIVELKQYRDDLEIFKMKKLGENVNFYDDSLFADKDSLQYATMKSSESGTIRDIISDVDEKLIDVLEVVKGELIINTTDKELLKIAQKAGVDVNPYTIVDGELQSSEGNLLLVDSAGTLTLPGTVTKIGSGAYRNVAGLKTIIIPKTVREISSHAFSGNKTLENVIIEPRDAGDDPTVYGMIKIGDYAFQDCTSLKSITIADSVTTLGSTCFGGCTNLTDIHLPNSLTAIPYRLFSACSNLVSFDIPESVTSFSSAAVESCPKIVELNIGKNVRSIGYSGGMSRLTSINIDSANPYLVFENKMVMNKAKTQLIWCIDKTSTTLTIPSTIVTISSEALSACSAVKTLNIPASTTSLGGILPSGITSVNVASGNTAFSSVDGNLYSADGKKLILWCQTNATARIADGTTTLEGRPFNGKSMITSLTLPDSLTTIPGFSLQGLSRVTSLTIPKNVSSLSSSSFSYSTTVTIASDNPYYKCDDGHMILSKDGKKLCAVSKSMSTYTIPSSVEVIGSSTFYAKGALTSLVIPSGVTTIQASAFDYSTKLATVEIPSTVTSIASSAFSRCNALTNIVIHKAEGSLSGAPWSAPYGLRAVKWQP